MQKKQRCFTQTIVLLLAALCVTALTAWEGMAEEVTVVMGDKKVILVKTADNFLIMYDRSSSMGESYGTSGMSELEAEIKILKEKNATLPNLNWQAGLFSFTPGIGGAEFFKTYQSMTTYNKETFDSVINGLPARPSGVTLLQSGLESLDPILKGLTGKTVVFLFTDGQYTPIAGKPSPGAIAKQLAQKYDLCFYVIDTDDSKKYDDAIHAVASATKCGKVLTFSELLGHPEWMTEALFIVKEFDKEVVAAGDTITGKVETAVLFDFNKADIKADFYVQINELAIFLQEQPQTQLILAGHTDNIGGEEYNMKLSQRRADAFRQFLVEKNGIDANRITLNWFGKDKPVASNDTEEGRAQNRRVTAVIVEGK